MADMDYAPAVEETIVEDTMVVEDAVVLDETAVVAQPGGYDIIDGSDVQSAKSMNKGVNVDLIILIVLLIALIGGGVFFFLRSRKSHQEVPQSDPEEQAGSPVEDERVEDEKVDM